MNRLAADRLNFPIKNLISFKSNPINQCSFMFQNRKNKSKLKFNTMLKIIPCTYLYLCTFLSCAIYSIIIKILSPLFLNLKTKHRASLYISKIFFTIVSLKMSKLYIHTMAHVTRPFRTPLETPTTFPPPPFLPS